MFAQTTTHLSLIQRLGRERDGGAWREFADRYEHLIRGVGMRYGLAGADADDLVQDVMLALTRAMPRETYDPARGGFRNYLRAIVVNAAFARLRQKMGAGPLGSAAESRLDDPGVPGVEDAWEAEWRQHHLRLAMKRVRQEFNATDLAAFEAYVVRGLDAAGVARELGLSVEQVYQAKSRILRRLSAVIASQVEEEG